MVLWQIDVAKRIAFPANPSGYYYWTSVYYIDRSDFISDLEARREVVKLDALICTEDVTITHVQVKSPPGRDNIIGEFTYGDTPGGITNASGEYSLINVARWHLFSDTGRRTYRLNRMPLRPGDWDGAELTDSGHLQQSASMGAFLGRGWCRNSYGELLTSGDVVRRLTMWQLRHGEKRRRRVMLV